MMNRLQHLFERLAGVTARPEELAELARLREARARRARYAQLETPAYLRRGRRVSVA